MDTFFCEDRGSVVTCRRYIWTDRMICILPGRLFLSSFTAFYATARSGAFLIAFVGVLLGFGLVLMHGKVFDFPLSMQRALCFLPGDWDPKAALEAKASSEWRDRMKTLFYKDYFHRAPILGQGYHFNPSFAQQATDIYQHVLAAMENRGDEFADVRNFIEMRQPHEGPIHLLLVVGMVTPLLLVSYRWCVRYTPIGSLLHGPRALASRGQ